MQMYFEVSNKIVVEKIKKSLLGQEVFFETLSKREKQYGADTSLIFHSLQTGLRFSCLFFKTEDKEKIDNSLFKTSLSVRNKTTGEYGHEARPRKANKKFYNEFMGGLHDFSYLELCSLLFNVESIPFGGLGIEFKDRGGKFYFSINRDIAIPHKEITATEYNNA